MTATPDSLEFYTAFILDFIREASALALKTQQTAAQSFKEDHSIVTSADLAISRLFKEKIAGLPDAADHFIIDEEDCGTVSVARNKIDAAKYVWTLDPIDGTTPYANKMPLWGCLVGLYQNGQPVLGAVSLPALNELLYTDGTRVFYQKDGGALQAVTVPEVQPFHRQALVFATQSIIARIMRNTENRQICRAMDVYTAAMYGFYTIVGRVRASFYHPGMSLWDIAAFLPITRLLGLQLVNTRTGAEITTLPLAHVEDNWKLADIMVMTLPDHLATCRALLSDDSTAKVA